MKELISYLLDLRKQKELTFQLIDVNDKVLNFMMQKKEYRDPWGSGRIVLSPQLLLKTEPGVANITKEVVCIRGFGYKSMEGDVCYGDLCQHYDRVVMEFDTEEKKLEFSRNLQKLIAGMLCLMENGRYFGQSPRVLIYYG